MHSSPSCIPFLFHLLTVLLPFPTTPTSFPNLLNSLTFLSSQPPSSILSPSHSHLSFCHSLPHLIHSVPLFPTSSPSSSSRYHPPSTPARGLWCAKSRRPSLVVNGGIREVIEIMAGAKLNITQVCGILAIHAALRWGWRAGEGKYLWWKSGR